MADGQIELFPGFEYRHTKLPEANLRVETTDEAPSSAEAPPALSPEEIERTIGYSALINEIRASA